jgi:type I restriction enzyme S subunit
MELKSGYKLTDVGVIPIDWDVVSIDEVALIKTGDKNTQDHVHDGYFPFFVRSQNIERINSYSFDCEAVLTAGDGVGTGKVFHYIQGKFDVHQRVYCIFGFDSEKIDGKYFYFYFGYFFYSRIMQMTAKSSVDSVRRNMIAKMRILLPPLPEQRAIAEALSDVDALLDGLDRLIAKKRDIKQATMQQLLTGKTRLPGFSGEWEVKRLGEIVDPLRGIRYGIVQPGNYDPNGRYMIRGQDYSETKGWAKPSEVFRVGSAIEERYKNARVIAGDLIMTIVGYCGHVEIVPDWLNGANLTQTTARIAIDSRKSASVFCKYMLLSKYGEDQVNSFMKGAAQPGLNCSDIEKFLIYLPPLPEQKAIAEVFSDMDAELEKLEERREKTREMKQGMMQALLTGRVRLVRGEE